MIFKVNFSPPIVLGKPGDWQFKMKDGWNGNFEEVPATGKWLWLGIKIVQLRMTLCPGRLRSKWHRPLPYSKLPEYLEQIPICVVCYRPVP